MTLLQAKQFVFFMLVILSLAPPVAAGSIAVANRKLLGLAETALTTVLKGAPLGWYTSTLRRYGKERRRRKRLNDGGRFSIGDVSGLLRVNIGDSQFASGGINDFRGYNPSSYTGQYLTTAFLDDSENLPSYTGSSSFYFRKR